MRKWVLAAALTGALSTISTAASAEGYGYCGTRGNGVWLVSPIFAWGDSNDFGMRVESNWKYFAWQQFKAEVTSRGDCSKFSSEAEARSFRSRLLNNIGKSENSKYRLELVNYIPVSPFGRPAAREANVRPAPERRSNSAEQVQPQLPQAAELKAQREAEFQAKLAAHEAQVAEYQRKLKAREAEIARQQAQHSAAQQAAAREQAAYEAKMDAHRLELEAANRRQQEYFAAQRRHSLCLTGDQKACDDIAAGRSALGDQAGTQEASTETDANRCVTTAEVRSNATFQGNTSASVMNGCGQPVDIRICLKRNNDWNCGVTSAVESQKQAVHSSFEASGEVFVDARTTGSSRRFADPPS